MKIAWYHVIISAILMAEIQCAEPLIGPIALGEGSAASNAIDAIAQMGASGIVTIVASTKDNISSDTVERSYKAIFRMSALQLPANTVPSLIDGLNKAQQAVHFTRLGSLVTASIPESDEDGSRIIAVLKRPLGIGAGTAIGFNDDGGLVNLASKLAEMISKDIPTIKTVHIFMWPKGVNFYQKASKKPDYPTLTVDPDMSMLAIMEKISSGASGLVWIMRIVGTDLRIMTTTIQAKRSTRPITEILADVNPANQTLGAYSRASPGVRYRKRLLIPSSVDHSLLSAYRANFEECGQIGLV